MKNIVSSLFEKSVLPALLLGAMSMLMSPVGAFAQSRGGHSRGFSGGRAYSGRNFSGDGYSRGYRGGGRSYNGGRYYDRGRYYGGGYYPGGYYSGFVAPYAYGFAPESCGYYDRWGYWHVYPGCYAAPWGY